ncbi:hypothetical protein JHJ32_04260 [Parapedobacter sp. ISTM3]|uniref:Uncharacterized protein n=1 Tax=Parapedobacter luteus TaxID=623280 RepID=A0A1T5C801_9SPHI|nr:MULTISPECIES: hypothetical protein [Parapedobacter]MBK1439191.1 hypothetical protein [Parapedobacter sp. ISTM3]SKB55250.1 hypothetical protein SAMN05660226_01920 [Parapedobacter luteus]
MKKRISFFAIILGMIVFPTKFVESKMHLPKSGVKHDYRYSGIVYTNSPYNARFDFVFEPSGGTNSFFITQAYATIDGGIIEPVYNIDAIVHFVPYPNGIYTITGTFSTSNGVFTFNNEEFTVYIGIE